MKRYKTIYEPIRSQIAKHAAQQIQLKKQRKQDYTGERILGNHAINRENLSKLYTAYRVMRELYKAGFDVTEEDVIDIRIHQVAEVGIRNEIHMGHGWCNLATIKNIIESYPPTVPVAWKNQELQTS